MKQFIKGMFVPNTDMLHRAESLYDQLRTIRETGLVKPNVPAPYAYDDDDNNFAVDDLGNIRVGKMDVLEKRMAEAQRINPKKNADVVANAPAPPSVGNPAEPVPATPAPASQA